MQSILSFSHLATPLEPFNQGSPMSCSVKTNARMGSKYSLKESIGNTDRILPMLDDPQIVICNCGNFEVWSTRQLTNTDDSTPHANTILGFNLSHDASLLAIVTETTIEIWDAWIGKCQDVIQTPDCSLVAFLPHGELIAW